MCRPTRQWCVNRSIGGVSTNALADASEESDSLPLPQSYIAGNGKVVSSLEGYCGLRTKLGKAGRFNQDTTVGLAHTCVIIIIPSYIIYL